MAFSTILQITAWIELQGAEVLDVLKQESGSIIYQVIGFKTPNLYIIDYREKVNRSYNECLADNDFTYFPYLFSNPAQIILQQNELGDLFLSLSDLIDRFPGHRSRQSRILLPRQRSWLAHG